MIRFLLFLILVVLLAAFFPVFLLGVVAIIGGSAAEGASGFVQALVIVSAVLFSGWLWMRAIPWLWQQRPGTEQPVLQTGSHGSGAMIGRRLGLALYALVGAIWILFFTGYVFVHVVG